MKGLAGKVRCSQRCVDVSSRDPWTTGLDMNPANSRSGLPEAEEIRRKRVGLVRAKNGDQQSAKSSRHESRFHARIHLTHERQQVYKQLLQFGKVRFRVVNTGHNRTIIILILSHVSSCIQEIFRFSRMLPHDACCMTQI